MVSVVPESRAGHRLTSMDNLLYYIGLCHTSTTDEPKKRRFYFRPLFIFTVLMVTFIQKSFALIIEDEDILLYSCSDVSHTFGKLKLLFNQSLITSQLLLMIFQIIYYYNYRKGVKPTFLKVFQVST